MKTRKRLAGIICAILTPFDLKGRVDVEALRRLVDFLIGQGVDGLLLGGSNGEGVLLSVDERKLLAETIVAQSSGRAYMLVHTGCITTAETVELTCHAKEIGADAASVITPYFYSYDDDAIFEHYISVIRAVPGFPVALYCFPGNAKQGISLELFSRLCEASPQIAGIKLSDPDLIRFQEYVQAGGEKCSPLCGVDALALPALSVGAVGQVSGNANVFPEVFRKLYDSFESGDLDQARRQQVMINRIRSVLRDDLVYLKAAMALRGISVGGPRPPLRKLTAAEHSRMEQGIAELGLL
jgi:4-hydroxy-tetrahydrodipicolinate synthase